LQSEIQSYKFNEKSLLQEHAANIQRSIYDFNNSTSNIFHFPKSFTLLTYVYNTNDQLIYSTSKENPSYENSVSQEYALSNNRLNAKRLILIKPLDFKAIYLKISILTLSIGLFIFISAFMILRQSIRPYKKAHEYLDAFFNDAMHELKTPLGIIQLNLELLESKITQNKELTRSLNAVKSLELIYGDIEYLMKYKHIVYTKESMDFSSFLCSRIVQFESLAHSKEIVLKSQIQEGIFLHFNRIELQRILDNTLSNAIKYSHKQSDIFIKLEQKEHIVLSIKDTGKGIEDTEKIFHRYYREDTIKGGFGIGLNIVKNICDKHGIIIKVNSTIKKGSTFSYTFKY
jgi:signal transduction histidine kinase